METDDRIELSIILPVHNEEENIREVLSEWAAEMDRLAIRHEMRVYDDGSTDDTGQRLEGWANRPAGIVLISQSNQGHGPTILRGYGEARGEWIFQVDSDGEMTPVGFEALWTRRQDFDLLLGVREQSHDSWARRSVSMIAGRATRVLFGAGVRDVNAPYRLVRKSAVQRFRPFIPQDTFATNVAMSGLAAMLGLRIFERPVVVERKATGSPALGGLRLWRTASRAFGETARIAWRARNQRRER